VKEDTKKIESYFENVKIFIESSTEMLQANKLMADAMLAIYKETEYES
jgi:hypothetical protein